MEHIGVCDFFREGFLLFFLVVFVVATCILLLVY